MRIVIIDTIEDVSIYSDQKAYSLLRVADTSSDGFNLESFAAAAKQITENKMGAITGQAIFEEKDGLYVWRLVYDLWKRVAEKLISGNATGEVVFNDKFRKQFPECPFEHNELA